jgi:hypothetical protein
MVVVAAGPPLRSVGSKAAVAAVAGNEDEDGNGGGGWNGGIAVVPVVLANVGAPDCGPAYLDIQYTLFIMLSAEA